MVKEFRGHLQGVFFFFFFLNSIVASGKILIRKTFLSCDFTCFTDLMDHPSASIITQVSRDEETSTPLRDRGESRESFESAHVKLLWWMFGAPRPLDTNVHQCRINWTLLKTLYWKLYLIAHFRTSKPYKNMWYPLSKVNDSWCVLDKYVHWL